MRLSKLALAIAFLFPSLVCAQGSDPARAAIAEGDLYQSKHKYELALDAYHKADKAAHHSSAEVYLKLAAVERKLGDFPSSLDNAKKAVKAAGDDKAWATQAYLIHANLLIAMSSKPGDKKLKEAESDIRQAVALDPSQTVAHFDLGFVLLKQERDVEGIPELRTYVSAPGAKREETVMEAKRLIANPIRAREPFAPPFSFTSEEKQKISNASLRGKVVLLDFWGTWCPPCRESVPALRNVQKKFAGKEFQIVSVSSDDDEEVWRTFIASQQMSWTEYIDLSGEIQSTFKIDSFPTYIVLDRDGVIRYRQSGYSQSTGPELEEAINHALKRASDPKLASVAVEDERAAAAAHSEAPARIAAEEKSSAASGGPSLSTDEPASPGLTGTEAGSVERGIYRNEALAFSYEFPRNWVAAKQEALHALNESHEESAQAALLQQHPEAAGTTASWSRRLSFTLLAVAMVTGSVFPFRASACWQHLRQTARWTLQRSGSFPRKWPVLPGSPSRRPPANTESKLTNSFARTSNAQWVVSVSFNQSCRLTLAGIWWQSKFTRFQRMTRKPRWILFRIWSSKIGNKCSLAVFAEQLDVFRPVIQ